MIYESASVLRHVKFSQDQKRLKQWPRRKVKFKDELQKKLRAFVRGNNKI